jgi:hypothetical protein
MPCEITAQDILERCNTEFGSVVIDIPNHVAYLMSNMAYISMEFARIGFVPNIIEIKLSSDSIKCLEFWDIDYISRLVRSFHSFTFVNGTSIVYICHRSSPSASVDSDVVCVYPSTGRIFPNTNGNSVGGKISTDVRAIESIFLN